MVGAHLRYDILGHAAIVADKGRNAAYAAALERLVTGDSVVLDIGAGSGILSLLACRAGARHVYAIEDDDSIQLAREAAAANGFADRITFIQGRSTEVTLPERVDGIVSEIHGALPLYGASIASIIDARERLLKPGGWLVPARESIWMAIVSTLPRERESDSWNMGYGFDFSSAALRSANKPRNRPVVAEQLLAPPQQWMAIDYATVASPSYAAELRWTLDRGGVAHGVAAWFDSETCAGMGFSNSPLSGEDHVFGQILFPWLQPVALAPGDAVQVRMRADYHGSDYLWTWNSRITSAAGAVKAAFRQSSFLSRFAFGSR